MKELGDRMEARRLFFPWQDDEESAWLERMHRDGWALEYAGFCRYRFKRGEGGTWRYRLDFRWLRAGDEPEYLALFGDAGWELAAKGNGWYYFRAEDKVHKGQSDEGRGAAGAEGQGAMGAGKEIYTDLQSRRRMYGAMLGFLALTGLPSLYFVLAYPARPNGASGLWLDIYGALKLVLGAVLALQALAALGIARRMSRLGKGLRD